MGDKVLVEMVEDALTDMTTTELDRSSIDNLYAAFDQGDHLVVRRGDKRLIVVRSLLSYVLKREYALDLVEHILRDDVTHLDGVFPVETYEELFEAVADTLDSVVNEAV